MRLAAGAVFALLGLVFGSFLNVVVHRLPRGESVVAPPSACPGCGARIRPRDNVPVVSWLLLRGRCRDCREPISAEYPAVEAACGGLFAMAALRLPAAAAVVVAPLLGVLLAAALIDARHRVIPNRLVYPSLALLAALIVGLRLGGAPLSPVRAALGLLAFGGGLLLVAVASPGGMGMGDVKLAALIGMVMGSVGWAHVAVAAVAAVLAGGIGALVALAAGRGRRDAIPFGPYLAAGALVSTLVAAPVAAWYGAQLALRAAA